MRPYTDTENTLLRDSDAPTGDHADASWPTLTDVDFHRRNAEIIRAEAVGDAFRFAIVVARQGWRKVQGHSPKLPNPVTKPGAPA